MGFQITTSYKEQIGIILHLKCNHILFLIWYLYACFVVVVVFFTSIYGNDSSGNYTPICGIQIFQYIKNNENECLYAIIMFIQ